MKKILLTLIFSFNYISAVDCCSSYGSTYIITISNVTVSVPRVEACPYVGGSVGYGYGTCYDDFAGVLSNFSPAVCESEGISTSFRLYNNEVSNNVAYFERQTRTVTQECACSESDTQPTEQNGTIIYDGIFSNAPSECIEAVLPYKTSSYKVDCEDYVKCWQDIPKPQYDCTLKGEGWIYNSSDTAEGCGAWTTNNDYDLSHFLSGYIDGVDYSDTCCLHEEQDLDSDGDTISDDDEVNRGTDPNANELSPKAPKNQPF